jgi:hypothetical protein
MRGPGADFRVTARTVTLPPSNRSEGLQIRRPVQGVWQVRRNPYPEVSIC